MHQSASAYRPLRREPRGRLMFPLTRHPARRIVATTVAILLWSSTPGFAVNDVTFDVQVEQYRRLVDASYPLKWKFMPSVPTAWRDDVRWAIAQLNNHPYGLDPQFEETTIGVGLEVHYEAFEPGTTDPARLTLRDVGSDPNNSGWTLLACRNGSNPCRFGINNFANQPTIRWHNGAPAPPSSGATTYVDARSSAMHELGHAIGLGHSRASAIAERHSPTTKPVMFPSGRPSEVRRTFTKDDCASGLLQRLNIATCNRSMADAAPGGSGADPKYFAGWGLSRGFEGQGCGSFPGLPSVCHWWMRAADNTTFGQFGAIYDVMGAGTDVEDDGIPGDASPLENTLRQGQQLKVRVRIGTPSSNSGSAKVKLCVYLRVQGSSQPYKAGAECTGVGTLAPGTDFYWLVTGYYSLPKTVYDRERLRTYLTVGTQKVVIDEWEIIRIY